MGALLLHVFIPACGRATLECVKKKRALFSCIEGGLRRQNIARINGAGFQDGQKEGGENSIRSN